MGIIIMVSPLINLKNRQIDNKCLRFSNETTQVDPRNCKSIPLNTSLEQTFVYTISRAEVWEERYGCQMGAPYSK